MTSIDGSFRGEHARRVAFDTSLACYPQERRVQPINATAPRTRVELQRDAIEIALGETRELHPIGEVLPKQSICVLVASALPWALGITEIDWGEFNRSAQQ